MGFDGPGGALQLMGVTLIGVTAENGRKLLLTLLFVAVAWLAGRAVGALAGAATARSRWPRLRFWARQVLKILLALTLVIAVVSIWFDDPTRLATALGLVTAGLAFALQRVITAVAGYVVILRGKTFNVGDRIVMGGVRGDVIALDFMQTTILEMGQPPPVQPDEPAMWVQARQYTGRVVTVTNAKIFDEPVYNYSRDFPYLFEEIVLPVRFSDDRDRAEAILRCAARRHGQDVAALAESEVRELQRRYLLAEPDLRPRVFWRITDNWLELTLRFLAPTHAVRELKDAITRDILAGLDEAGIPVASATFELAGAPVLRVGVEPTPGG